MVNKQTHFSILTEVTDYGGGYFQVPPGHLLLLFLLILFRQQQTFKRTVNHGVCDEGLDRIACHSAQTFGHKAGSRLNFCMNYLLDSIDFPQAAALFSSRQTVMQINHWKFSFVCTLKPQFSYESIHWIVFGLNWNLSSLPVPVFT